MDDLERKPGDRGKKLHHANNQRRMKEHKSSVLRYHRELRRELGEVWIQSLRTELEPDVQRLSGEDWKEEAQKYLRKLEEEERKRCHSTTKELVEEERDQKGEDTQEEERKTEENPKDE